MVGHDSSLRAVVGKPTADALDKAFGTRTVGELLARYPRRYVARGDLSELKSLENGAYVTVVAEVVSARLLRMKQRRGNRAEIVITDGNHLLSLTFFNQDWRVKQLQPGTRAFFSGVLSSFNGKPQLTHPACQVLGAAADDDAVRAVVEETSVMAIYAATKDIKSWDVALAVRVVLDLMSEVPDPLPREIMVREQLLPYASALRMIHRPNLMEEVQRARDRLKWDEALQLQIVLAQRRAEAQALPAVARRPSESGLRARFEQSLPYVLTAGQREVSAHIDDDLAQVVPMHRLLAGEVGSGKTVVALLAMLTVVDGGGQAALLAPTEVLAAQHLRSLRDLLGPLGRAGELDGDPLGTQVALLTGSQGAAERRAARSAVADGSAGIVVGTHALLSEGVEFHDLALVVVDEQHRFGVEQRAVLRARGREGTTPHLLVMTATPIPRTVAMTVFGDLATSQLTELPRGRQEIVSFVVPDAKVNWVDRMWQKVRVEVADGHQAYVVCPRIESTEDDQPGSGAGEARRPAAAAEDMLVRLGASELAGVRLGLLHGRLPSDQKDAVMRAFAAGEIDVLVATTVIEVGVDVPNASVMVVLDADRFGVSQLHQLRGRVGRGSAASTCFLHTASWEGSDTYARLQAVAATNDGAELARVDLTIRGEGDVLGAAQAGANTGIRLLRLLEDEELVIAARSEAQRIVRLDPTLSSEPALRGAISRLLDEAAENVTFLEKG